MDYLEIEVKFYLTDVPDIRNKIIELGSKCLGKNFEINIKFEDKDHNLTKKSSLLRLRQDKTSKLTFKSLADNQDNEFKILKELEVEVSDFQKMFMILESIGFHQEQKYEKWRETFTYNQTQICIDTMPFGDFLEIEGKKDDIKYISSQLGLNWDNRIVLNYLEIFSIIKNRMNLSFFDVSFDNFKNVKIMEQMDALI